MHPKISFIIPIYNVETYIKHCLESVVNQTLKEVEIILVNDGTEDNSIKNIREYIGNDSRIKLINKQNGGVSSARNRALDEAKGEYILFVDSDDYIENNMAEVMYNCAISNKVDIVMCGYNRIDNDKKTSISPPIKSNIIYSNKEIKNIISYGDNSTIWYVWRNLYKREIIEKNNIRFNESVKIGEDSCFNLNTFLSSNSIISINKFLYNYRKNNNSLTQGKYNKDLGNSIISQYIEKLSIYNKYNLHEDTYKSLYLSFITHSMNTMINNIYNSNSENKIKEIKELRNGELIKNAINNISIIKIIQSNYPIGIKLRTILIKYKKYKILNSIYGRV